MHSATFKTISQSKNLGPILLVSGFFAVFLAVGVLWFRDYGTHVDEYAQIVIGQRTASFLKTFDAQFLDFRDWDHGAVFEMLTVLTTLFLHHPYEFGELYYLRHLDVFLTFWASGVAFFLLAWQKFKSWKMGLLGSAMLFLSPVMFGNAFFNSKDIPFLSFYIFSLCTLTIFLDRPTLPRAALHAVVCALLVNIRIPGVIIPALTLGILGLELALPGRRRLHPNPRGALLAGAAFILLLVGCIILFFPAAWSDPISIFINAFIAMSQRNWFACNLFLGSCLTADETPWYYVPVWLGISTPLLYVGLAAAGLFASAAGFFRRPVLEITPSRRSALIYLGALILPWLAVAIGRSVIYNSYRHLFFIYAPFLVLALEGFSVLYRFLQARLRRVGPAVMGIGLAISFISTAAFMVRNHPYEFIYFNPLAGADMQAVKQNYELDYWGLSYIDAIRYILAHDPRPSLRIKSPQVHLKEYTYMLSEAEQSRLKISLDDPQPNYFVGDYYMHPQEYKEEAGKLFYEIKVDGAAIVTVLRLPYP